MTPPNTERFDAIIIGTGQAGKPLAGALAEKGWRTAIVERDRVGGTCVVRGCTPTKTMIASARVAHLARRASAYGVRTGDVSVDMEAVRLRKREIVDSWSEGSRRGMERHSSIDLVMGEARFVGERELEVGLHDGGTLRMSAKHVFINTGAHPSIPEIPGLQDAGYLDSTSIMELGEVPRHLIVLGGGFVGLEFAQMFRRFGSDVTILQQGDRLIGQEDEDVSNEVRKILEEEGITVRTGTTASAVASTGAGGVAVHVEPEGSEAVVAGSHLLVATGRTPNTAALHLEATGLNVDDEGYVPVNGRLETRVEGIWALGDVAGSAPFTHTAYDDFRVVRANLLEARDTSRDTRISTYVLFIDPQLGRVGWTEREARESGRRVRIAKLPMSRVARAIETDETRGFIKAVVDGDTNRILGAAVLGVEGGEVAAVLQTAMMGDLPYTALRDAMIAHPTLSESLNNLFKAIE